jgi:hypothetical protein
MESDTMSGLDKSAHTFYNGRVSIRKGLVDKKLDCSLLLGFDWLGIGRIRIATNRRWEFLSYAECLFQPVQDRQRGLIILPCFCHSVAEIRRRALGVVFHVILIQRLNCRFEVLVDLF